MDNMQVKFVITIIFQKTTFGEGLQTYWHHHIFVSVPKSGPGFSILYVVVVLVCNDLRREVIVRFVDIGGIVDHHCLNFVFITLKNLHYCLYQIKK
jgi:hypothetical protein